MAVIGDVNIVGVGGGRGGGTGQRLEYRYCGSWDRDFGIFIQCY